MANTLKTLAVNVAFALTAGTAMATGYHTPKPEQPKPTQPAQPSTSNSTSGAVAGAVSGSKSTSTSTSNASSVSGATNKTDVNNLVSVGGPEIEIGGNQISVGGPEIENNSKGIAKVGDVTVSPTQVSEFRSFVGSNAPHVAAAVDGCLAVSGFSVGVGGMGNTNAGNLVFGNNSPEFIQACAGTMKAMELYLLAKGDPQKELFAINLLLESIPEVAKPAMNNTVKEINAYEGEYEPDSYLGFKGVTKTFKKRAAPEAVVAPVAAPAPVVPNVTVNLGGVNVTTPEAPKAEVKTVTRTIVRKVNPDGTPYVAPKKDCNCAPGK